MSYSSRFSSRSSTSSGSPARNGNTDSNQTTTTTTTTSTNRTPGQSPQKKADSVSAERVKLEMNSLQRQIDELDRQLETQETQDNADLDRIVEDVKENTR